MNSRGEVFYCVGISHKTKERGQQVGGQNDYITLRQIRKNKTDIAEKGPHLLAEIKGIGPVRQKAIFEIAKQILDEEQM